MSNKNKQPELKVLGQGTYGCVVDKDLECGLPRQSKQSKQSKEGLISKIQGDNKTSKNEIEIGKKILHSNRFAPIYESCPLTSGKIQQDILKECDKLDKTTETMIISKVRYVGKDTLDTFLHNIITSTSRDKTKKYLQQVLNKHLFLLESLVILNKEKVLHLDIKSNNIMIDKKTHPIMIDFGISYDGEKLQLEEYKKTREPFGIVIDYYLPWCFEIILLTHISRYLIGKKDGKTIMIDPAKEHVVITPDEIAKMKKDILGKFMKKNTLLQMSIFTEEEKKDYLSRLQQWINSFEGKTWTYIWNKIVSTKDTWDNYALTTVIISELDISGIKQLSSRQTKGFLYEYIQVIKGILLGKTSVPGDTLLKIKDIFKTVAKTEYNKLIVELGSIFKDGKIVSTMAAKRNAINDKTLHEKDMLLNMTKMV